MTKEELFAAIGTVEISRLAKSEQGISALRDDVSEVLNMKKTTITMGRVLRNLLVAAIVMSLLAVTAYAVAGYVIYDNPEDMISSIFGDKTGFDHKPYTEVPIEDGSDLVFSQAEYDRVEADPKVVKEDVAPYVSPVGRSVTFENMTLTVDSFLYDSGTKCGLITYTLTNPPEIQLQYDGRFYYKGWSAVSFTDGEDYIIQEKTTEDTLAAAHYFQYDEDGREFSVGLYREEEAENSDEKMLLCMDEVKTQYTPEEAIAKAWEIAKERNTEKEFRQDVSWFGEEWAAYRVLRDALYSERYGEPAKSSTASERITFDCSQSRGIRNITLGGGVTLSPISMQANFRNIAPLRDAYMEPNFSVSISFRDGTEYLVQGKNSEGNDVQNRLSAMWNPEDCLTIMFNRVIDLDQVTSVKINGTELTRD